MLNKTLFWVPRILGIISILFLLMFGFDVFGGNEPFLRQLLGFLMHSIPALVLIVILIIAWKYEVIGGSIFIVVFFAMAIYFRSFTTNRGSLIVLIPFLLTGILFILHHVVAEKKTQVQ